MWRVLESKKSAKQLAKIPVEVLEQYEFWKSLVETQGPASLLGIKGFYDHSLKGEWAGARASSLNRK